MKRETIRSSTTTPVKPSVQRLLPLTQKRSIPQASVPRRSTETPTSQVTNPTFRKLSDKEMIKVAERCLVHAGETIWADIMRELIERLEGFA